MEKIPNISRTHLTCGSPLLSFNSTPSKKEYLCIGCLLNDLLNNNQKNEDEKKAILKKITFALRASCNLSNSYPGIGDNKVASRELFEGLICLARKWMRASEKRDDYIRLFGEAIVVAFCHKSSRKADVVDLCCLHVVKSFRPNLAEEDNDFVRFIVCVIEKLTEWMNVRGMPFFTPVIGENPFVRCFGFGILPQLLGIPKMMPVALRIADNFVGSLKFVDCRGKTIGESFTTSFDGFINNIICCASKYIVSVPNPKVRKSSLSKFKFKKASVTRFTHI